MKLLLIVNTADKFDKIFDSIPKLNFQPILISPIYDVHKLMNGAKDNNKLAEAEIKKIINDTNKLKPIGIEIVKALYNNKEKIIIIDGAFLTSNDVIFISTTLDSTYRTVILNYIDDDVLLFTPAYKHNRVILNKDEVTFTKILDVAFDSISSYNSNKLDKLLDEVDKELDKLTEISKRDKVNPTNLSLIDLLSYLNNEWHNDKSLKTLPLKDIVKLIGYKLVKDDDDEQ